MRDTCCPAHRTPTGMSERGSIDCKCTTLQDLLSGQFYQVPGRNRAYHSYDDRQRVLCEDLWATLGYNDEKRARDHYLNTILLFTGSKYDSSRYLVLDAGSRMVGVMVLLSAVRQVVRATGHEGKLNHVQSYLTQRSFLDGKRESYPRVVIQDRADARFQVWVISENTEQILADFENRQALNRVERSILESLEVSLDFFAEKLSLHSLSSVRSHFADPQSNVVTFKSLQAFCLSHPDSRATLEQGAECLIG